VCWHTRLQCLSAHSQRKSAHSQCSILQGTRHCWALFFWEHACTACSQSWYKVVYTSLLVTAWGASGAFISIQTCVHVLSKPSA
jgi:hypothetical protein